jgi:putative transposase
MEHPMPQRAATIESLPAAFAVVKAMQADGLDGGEGYRRLGRQALAEIIETEMAAAVDRWLESLEAEDAADRRNGYYRRSLLTELGEVELSVPRTRRYCPTEVVRAYARRSPEIDRTILAGFVLGLSTRKLGEVLLDLLGRPVGPATVSRVARTLDAAVEAFHARPLKGRYKALMLDGVVLARKTGAGALRRPVLVALGLRQDGKKEVIDYRLARGESAVEWERFLADLYKAGPHRRRPRHDLRRRRLRAHRRPAHGLRQNPRSTLLGAQDPQRPQQGQKSRREVRQGRPARRHERRHGDEGALGRPPLRPALGQAYPAAVACLRDDLDELLTCFRYKTLAERKPVRTTNAIERRFREVRRRTRPIGVFQDRTSMDRILFAVFTHENKMQAIPTLLTLTQNS